MKKLLLTLLCALSFSLFIGCKSTQLNDYVKEEKERTVSQTSGNKITKETHYNKDGSVDYVIEEKEDYTAWSSNHRTLDKTVETETKHVTPEWIKYIVRTLVIFTTVGCICIFVYVQIKKWSLVK